MDQWSDFGNFAKLWDIHEHCPAYAYKTLYVMAHTYIGRVLFLHLAEKRISYAEF